VAAAILAAAFAGCGGESMGDEASTVTDGGSGEVVVAALGDSITAGSPLWDPDEAIRAQIPSPDERSQFEYWATRERPELEFRNCGVFGERTDEIAARLDDCAAGADALVVQGGINDIAQGAPADAAAENIMGIVRAGKEAGLDVTLVDVLPWNNGHPAADDPIAQLNDAIREIGRSEDVEVVPFHDELEDPSAPGTMTPELTDDGDHPSVEGYRRLGSLLAQRLAS
jgi:lysophospholipase L1-like esterase